MRRILCLVLVFAATLAEELPDNDRTNLDPEDELADVDLTKLTPAVAIVNKSEPLKSLGAVAPTSSLGKNPGERAIHGLFPYHVALCVDKVRFCSGGLISVHYVLTAAHCVYKSSVVTAYAGMHSLAGNKRVQLRVAISTQTHPLYNLTSMENDIALISINKSTAFSPNAWVQPIPVIPLSPTKTYTGNWARTSGWASRGALREYLHFDDFTVINNTECQNTFGQYVTNNTLCAVPLTNRTTCVLDGGSPLVDLESGVLIGLATFRSSAPCTSALPAAYVRLSSYITFIPVDLSPEEKN